MSALQMHRMMGGSYKTAWFMMHRIREAMREGKLGPLGGKGKFVEADETYVGGKAKNRAFKAPLKKKAVMALVERGGKVASVHVPNVTAKTLPRSSFRSSIASRIFAPTKASSIRKWAMNSPAVILRRSR
jgi:hypothetical protein